MIEFNIEIPNFTVETKSIEAGLHKIAKVHHKQIGDLNYTFLDDEQLLEINQKYLDHDNYTDIITFDATVGTIVSGDIFISVTRVRANAVSFDVSFDQEFKRVIAHGLLHLCGFKDKTSQEALVMRQKENQAIELF